jgi:hypothetical protein
MPVRGLLGWLVGPLHRRGHHTAAFAVAVSGLALAATAAGYGLVLVAGAADGAAAVLLGLVGTVVGWSGRLVLFAVVALTPFILVASILGRRSSR